MQLHLLFERSENLPFKLTLIFKVTSRFAEFTLSYIEGLSRRINTTKGYLDI